MVKVPPPGVRRSLRLNAGVDAIGKGVDVLAYLDYVLFLKELAKESGIIAKQSKSSQINDEHVRRAKQVVLKRFKS